MTDLTIAKRIGYRQAFKGVTVGLVMAYLIMAGMAGPLWLFHFAYSPTLIFSALVLYVTAYLFGGFAGRLIIIRHYSPLLVGVLCALLIVWSATFVGSLIGFFREGVPHHAPISEPIEDYILKPIALVTFYGLLPIVGTGIWYGLSIKRKGGRVISA